MYKWILGVSITVFVLSLCCTLINISGDAAHIKVIFNVIEMTGYFIMQVLYYLLKKSIAKVNLDLLNYVIENNCTDGALKRALEVYTLKYDSDLQLAFASTIAVAFSVGLTLLAIYLKNRRVLS